MEGACKLMGSRGSFLESGGFSTPAQWHAVDYVDGIKVLEPKNPKASISLPERSNTPGTAYISYRRDDAQTFSQLRVFGEDRIPEFDIDYGTHQGKKSLHVHYYNDGVRSNSPIEIHPGDALYERYKRIFRGVPK